MGKYGFYQGFELYPLPEAMWAMAQGKKTCFLQSHTPQGPKHGQADILPATASLTLTATTCGTPASTKALPLNSDEHELMKASCVRTPPAWNRFLSLSTCRRKNVAQVSEVSPQAFSSPLRHVLIPPLDAFRALSSELLRRCHIYTHG